MYLRRYTSTLFSNNHLTHRSAGDNLSKLTVQLFCLLENENTSATGVITDNITGDVIKRCRKVSD